MGKAEEIAINTDGAAGYREKENDVLFENDIMDKQYFTSSKAIECSSKYAVGVVHGNEIHVTPLKGIYYYLYIPIEFIICVIVAFKN